MNEPSLPPVHLECLALWSSRLSDWESARAVIRGERRLPDSILSRPAPSLLAPTERRRAPDTVAVALEVAMRACEGAKRSPADMPSVFASTHGDLAISDYMCATLASTPALISPIKFHNSVHNAAAGYWSIGTGSYAPYTAISAYEYTFAAGLLEAANQAICEQTPVLYVAFDIEARGALASVAPSRGLLGVGMVIGPQATERSQSLALQLSAGNPFTPTPARSAAFECVAGNALAPCFAFLEALATDGENAVQLALGDRSALLVTVS